MSTKEIRLNIGCGGSHLPGYINIDSDSLEKLKKGGVLNISTTDFEEIAKIWLAAKDEWKEFFRNDLEAISREHWFGQYSYSTENRWGYLSAMIFGSQNGEEQFHKNCYTEGKLSTIMDYLGFTNMEVSRFRWKTDRDPVLGLLL